METVVHRSLSCPSKDGTNFEYPLAHSIYWWKYYGKW